MEVINRIFHYIKSRKDILLMYWDNGTGWHTELGKFKTLKDADKLQIDLFFFFYWVHGEDLPTFRVFLNQLSASMNGKPLGFSVEDEKKSIAVRLLEQSGDYLYCNINCWFGWENEKLECILVEIAPLDTEEIHRIQIAKNFTSDSEPELFQKQAIEMIHSNPDKKYAFIQFDVAKFKMVLADYGEEKSSELLNYFISTLKVICNKNQLYSRLSADIFMILTPYEDEKELRDFVELLDEHLHGYENLSYRIVYGICYIGDISEGIRQYEDAAAMARQSIKDNALQKVAFYNEDLKRKISVTKFIEDNMEHALENGEFIMYLQPKCNISDEKIVGAEALVRWDMPGHGIIPPNDFVPVFEKNGFIVKMDQYIWEEACKLIRKWIDSGVTPIPISINVSRRHFVNTEFIQVLNHLIEKYDIPKKYLEIEITETVDESGIGESMEILKEDGFRLLMDDFGSGYSSLNTLKDTQFDVLKIDRTFLNDFIGSDRGQKIVEHTIKMAKSIGIDLIAEGVETKEQADFLNDCGCSIAQGFYYAKPMPVDLFETNYVQ